jgi:O-antigen/teichoic acid export membrane protein
VLVGFALQLILARVLGTEEFGRYTFVIAWINLLAIVGVLGLDTAALRFIPIAEVKKDWSRLLGFILRSRQAAVLACLLLSALVGVAIPLLDSLTTRQLARLFFLALPILPALVLLTLVAAQLQALHHVVSAQALRTLLRPTLTAVIVLMLVVFLDAHTAQGGIVANLAATLATLAVTWGMVKAVLPSECLRATPQYETKRWMLVALPLYLISAFHLLLAETDVLMLGMLLGTTESGIYAVASKIVILVPFGINAANAILAPTIARLYASGRRAEMQGIVTLVTRSAFLLGLFTAGALLIASPLVLRLYGADFARAYPAILILTVGLLVSVGCGPVSFLLTMTAHERDAAWIIGGAAGMNVALNAVLIPRHGIEGAALATTISVAMRSVFLSLLVRRRLQLNVSVLSLTR